MALVHLPMAARRQGHTRVGEPNRRGALGHCRCLVTDPAQARSPKRMAMVAHGVPRVWKWSMCKPHGLPSVILTVGEPHVITY